MPAPAPQLWRLLQPPLPPWSPQSVTHVGSFQGQHHASPDSNPAGASQTSWDQDLNLCHGLRTYVVCPTPPPRHPDSYHPPPTFCALLHGPGFLEASLRPPSLQPEDPASSGPSTRNTLRPLFPLSRANTLPSLQSTSATSRELLPPFPWPHSPLRVHLAAPVTLLGYLLFAP